MFDFNHEEIIKASAKVGIGIPDILNAIIERMPCPKSSLDHPLKALLFDSWFDIYKGVICLIALKDGVLKKGDQYQLAQAGREYEVLELGLMYPDQVPMNALYAGQVGYLIAGMKTVQEARVGETIYHAKKPVVPFPGFKPAKPMVFAGIFPIDSEEFEVLRDSIEKLTLNDASVQVEKKNSTALGLGFRCGFLGFFIWMFLSSGLSKNMVFRLSSLHQACFIKLKLEHTGETIDIESPSDFPDPSKLKQFLNRLLMQPFSCQKNIWEHYKACAKKNVAYNKTLEYLNEERIILKVSLTSK